MRLVEIEEKFLATAEKGAVSALLMRPEGATHLLVLGHGASSNMRTPILDGHQVIFTSDQESYSAGVYIKK